MTSVATLDKILYAFGIFEAVGLKLNLAERCFNLKGVYGKP